MDSRPVIHIQPTTLDRIMEALIVIVLLVMWILVVFNYEQLPDMIPTHFDGEGKVNEYSRKASIFVMSGIATGIFIGMKVLGMFPHIYNYGKNVTAHNATELYKIGTDLVRSINLGIAITFMFITWRIVEIAKSQEASLGGWFFPLFLACIFAPVIYFIFRMIRVK